MNLFHKVFLVIAVIYVIVCLCSMSFSVDEVIVSPPRFNKPNSVANKCQESLLFINGGIYTETVCKG